MDWTNADLRSMEETSSEFIAWHVGQRTSWIKCQTSVEFTTSTNGIAGCCSFPNLYSDGNCAVQTACVGTRVLLNDGSQRECPNNTECKDMDIFDNYVPGSLPDGSLRLVLYMSSTWDRRTLFQRIGEATATPTSSESSASESSTHSTPSPTSSDDTSVDEESPSSSASKAWIAGAVIGPLFLIALIILTIWWFKRRSKAKAAAAGQPLPGNGPTQLEAKHHSQPPMAPGYQQQPYLYDPHYQDDQRWSAATGSPPLSTSPY